MNQDKHQWHELCCTKISAKPPTDLKHLDWADILGSVYSHLLGEDLASLQKQKHS